MAHGLTRLAAAMIGVGLGAACLGSGLSAEPLAKEACDTLKTEHAALEAAGLPETVRKGAVWGRANLSAAKLKEVERYIGLEEQMQFRCGLARLRVLPGAEGEETGDPDKAADKPAADSVAPAAAVPAPQPKPKPKPKPAAEKAAAPAPENAEAAAQLKSKPKPKPKADDAFKPPPLAKE